MDVETLWVSPSAPVSWEVLEGRDHPAGEQPLGEHPCVLDDFGGVGPEGTITDHASRTRGIEIDDRCEVHRDTEFRELPSTLLDLGPELLRCPLRLLLGRRKRPAERVDPLYPSAFLINGDDGSVAFGELGKVPEDRCGVPPDEEAAGRLGPAEQCLCGRRVDRIETHEEKLSESLANRANCARRIRRDRRRRRRRRGLRRTRGGRRKRGRDGWCSGSDGCRGCAPFDGGRRCVCRTASRLVTAAGCHRGRSDDDRADPPLAAMHHGYSTVSAPGSFTSRRAKQKVLS